MRIIATIGTTLLALGIASTALAIEPPANDTPPQQGGQSGGQSGGKGDGKPSGKDGERPGRGNRPDFKTLDKNGDGFITQDEVPAEAWERVYVSGGRRGLDLGLAPADLIAVTSATVAAIGRAN